MNHAMQVPAVPATTDDELLDGEGAGAFRIWVAESGTYIIYLCPCGCGQVNQLPIRVSVDAGRGWAWNGDPLKPTLDPSIRRMDGCRWHGYLKAGTWTPCGDSGR